MKKNPFLTYGYAGAEYFCDREAETKKLIMQLTNGNNVVLKSPFDKQLITHNLGTYEIYDKFLSIWINKNYQ